MAVNYGKNWEEKFKTQFKSQFPDLLLERIYDQVTMYKDVSQNPADYYLFDGSTLAYIECKETGEGTLNFSKFPQLDRLLEKIQYKNVQAYVLIWFRSKQRVVILSAQEADKIRQDGHKSIALAMLEKKSYNIIEIPATFPRTYPVCDWSKLVEVIKDDR